MVQVGGAVARFDVGDLACPIYLSDWVDGPSRPHHGTRRLGGPSGGVLAELMCLPEQEAVRVPPHLDVAGAATLPVAGVTAGVFPSRRPPPACALSAVVQPVLESRPLLVQHR